MKFFQKIVYVFIITSFLLTNNPLRPSVGRVKKVKFITVLIHGLVGFESKYTAWNFFNIINDKINETSYEKWVAIKRADRAAYAEGAKQDLGLHQVKIDAIPGNGAGATADLLQQINALVNPMKRIDELFFTFGWSGLANRSAQKEAGIELYYALEKLTQNFEKQDITLKIRVIGSSHGGNVALNMGAALPLKYQSHTFHIDQLILLATPIICETDYLAQSTLFKKIYNIYSRADKCQEIDFLSFKRFGSQKSFTSRNDFQVPSNICQIQIRITDVTKQYRKQSIDTFHTPYEKSFIMGQSSCLQDNSPGHLDLWKISPLWTGKIRTISPINPLPLVVFIPYILHSAKIYTAANKIDPNKSIIVDFRPRCNHMIIRQENEQLPYIMLPMIGLEKISELAKIARCYKPNEIAPTN